jgi:hypothetical protein
VFYVEKSRQVSEEEFWRQHSAPPFPANPQLPGGRSGEGRRDSASGVRHVDEREMQGAFRKTSGRSIFPNAPLRATSSGLDRSMSVATRKPLRICIVRAKGRVGFALGRKLLRLFTNL